MTAALLAVASFNHSPAAMAMSAWQGRMIDGARFRGVEPNRNTQEIKNHNAMVQARRMAKKARKGNAA